MLVFLMSLVLLIDPHNVASRFPVQRHILVHLIEQNEIIKRVQVEEGSIVLVFSHYSNLSLLLKTSSHGGIPKAELFRVGTVGLHVELVYSLSHAKLVQPNFLILETRLDQE
jgi:hypothetical protein